MDTDKQIVDDIESLTMDLFSVFNRMKSIPGMYDKTIKREETACKLIPRQIRSKIIKIAVVGAIKSGKSTFINSWLKADILKRGAGVVTSIVTRVKKGDFLSAAVALKSWDEINSEIEKALLFFPDLKNIAALNNIYPDLNGRWFDLRRRNDRQLLTAVKKQLCHGNLVTEAGLRQESVIINQALDGFAAIKTKIQPECAELVFSGDNFDEYKQFTGNDALAFFVKDVCLNVVSSSLDFFMEIADCQGSDSINPSHMAQIQDYLVSSSMIIYLVSSRTGIREADIRFLNIIRNMGLLDRIFFIVNVDFDEHVSFKDLIYVENSIKTDLSYIKQTPMIFTFSSLYNLFSHSFDATTSYKEKNRFENWKQDTELILYSDRMTENFYSELDRKLTGERNSLLIANHVEHMRIMEKNAEKKVELFKKLLSQDLTKAVKAVTSLQERQKHARKFDSTIKNSLDVAVEALKSGIEREIHGFFDPLNGRAYQRIKKFIENYEFDYGRYELKFDKTGFDNTLYHMFHDFRTQLDLFMTEKFTPQVTGFIKNQEQRINQCLRDFYSSCRIDTFEIFSEFTGLTEKLPSSDKKNLNRSRSAYSPVDLKAVKGIMGLAPPRAVFAPRYSAKIKLGSMAGFWFHFLSEIMNRAFKGRSRAAGFSGLKNAGARIKKQTMQSLILYLNAYSADLRSRYFLKLIPAVSRDFHDKLMDGFQMCDLEMEKIEALVKAEQWEKESQIQILKSMEAFLKKSYSKIETL